MNDFTDIDSTIVNGSTVWRFLENVKSKGKDKVKDEVKGKEIDKVEVFNPAMPLLRWVLTIENIEQFILKSS